jgi:excisionase family DNA binding protein
MTQENSTPTSAFLTLREAAAYAHCSTTTLRRAVRSGELAHHRHGHNEKKSKIFIRVTDMEKYLNGCRLG